MTSTSRSLASSLCRYGYPTALALVCLIVLGLTSPVVVHADGNDQRRALEALKAGEIVSLRTMLDEVEARYSGDVLEVELDDEYVGGKRIWIYKIKLLTPQGNVIKMKIDAKSKEILEIEGRGIERARKK